MEPLAAAGVTADEAAALVTDEPRDAADAAAAAPEAPDAPLPGFWARTWHLWALLFLTAFAAFLRFYWIDRPAIWGDEAHTYRRLTGEFQVVLDILKGDGFGPLTYEWFWWLGQRLGGPENLTPFWMRLLSSACGTLMVPAVFLLARELVSRRAAVLAAAFAACSAYLNAYSHDAKMYMPLWCFGTLSVGLLLWWLRTGARLGWLAWIAAGLATAGTHAPGLIVVGLQPLFFLVRPSIRRGGWRQPLLFVAGLAVIASGPAVHYTLFDRWARNVNEDSWGKAGLGWIPPIVQGRDDGDLVRFIASAYLYSWEWPDDAYRDTPVERARRNTPVAFAEMLSGFCIDPARMAFLKFSVVSIVFLAAAGAFPWSRRLRGNGPLEPPSRQPWAIAAFWLGAWILVPAYWFYLTTSRDPMIFFQREPLPPGAPPGARGAIDLVMPEVIRYPLSLMGVHWAVLLVEVALVALLCASWRRLPTALLATAGVLVLISLNVAILQSGAFPALTAVAPALGAKPPAAAATFPPAWWMIPSLVAERWAEILCQPLFLLAGAILLPALAWHYVADTTAARLARLAQLAAVLAGLWLLLVGVQYGYEDKLRFRKPGEWTPMFIPRYFGIIWPAIAVGLAALLMRLPTVGLRAVAVAIVLGTNLSQVFHKFDYGEPPVDHLVADVYGLPGTPDLSFNQRHRAWKDKDKAPPRKPDPSVLTYIQEGPISRHPAGGFVYNLVGKYHISILGGVPYSNRQMQADGNLLGFVRVNLFTRPDDQAMARAAAGNPAIERLIIWDRHRERPARNVKSMSAAPAPAAPARPARPAATAPASAPAEPPPPAPVPHVVTVVTDGPHGLARGDQVTLAGVSPAPYNGTFTVTRAATETSFDYALPDAPGGLPDARNATLAVVDPVAATLGPAWKPVGEWWIPVLYHWNWSELYTWRRREYARTAPPP